MSTTKKKSPATIIMLVLAMVAGGYFTQVRGPRAKTAELTEQIAKANAGAPKPAPLAADETSVKAARGALAAATAASIQADVKKAAGRTAVNVTKFKVAAAAPGVGSLTAKLTVTGKVPDLGSFVASLAGNLRLDAGQLRGDGRLYVVDKMSLRAAPGGGRAELTLSAPAR